MTTRAASKLTMLMILIDGMPSVIRLPHNRLVTRADGCRVKRATQITHHRRGRRCTATLDGMARPRHCAALKPKDGDRVITAPNRPGHHAPPKTRLPPIASVGPSRRCSATPRPEA